jgi:N-acyl homoserine lactone hydrolase
VINVESRRTTKPISALSMVSTGMFDIRSQHVRSTGSPAIWWLMTTRRWTSPRPINVYIVEHRDGLVLFDTGHHRASLTDSDYFPGSGFTGLIYRRLARFEIDPDRALAARPAAVGYEIADVRTVVLSHLHQDHLGGLHELGHADIVLDRREWLRLKQPRPEGHGLLVKHIDLPGLRWHPLTSQPIDDPELAPLLRRTTYLGTAA